MSQYSSESISSGIRARDLMGPLTTVQQMELLEEKVSDLKEKLKGMATKAVETTIDTMCHTLTKL